MTVLFAENIYEKSGAMAVLEITPSLLNEI